MQRLLSMADLIPCSLSQWLATALREITAKSQVQQDQRSEMTSLKMFCSVCLGFVEQEENKRENEFKIDKKIIETTLRRHFDDPSIKVGFIRVNYKNIPNYSRQSLVFSHLLFGNERAQPKGLSKKNSIFKDIVQI